MIQALNTKIVTVTLPVAIVDNASWTTAAIDTIGYDYLSVYVNIGALDIAMVALKLQTSNTDGSYADLDGADFDGDTESDGTTAELPQDTDDGKWWAIHVNLLDKKRFFDLVATGGDGSVGTFLVAFAVLTRAHHSPDTQAERGMTGGELIV